MLSYFTLVNDNWVYGHNQINKLYNELQNSSDVEVIDEEVFQFFDCFPYAPVHNLDDTYNLLYSYINNDLLEYIFANSVLNDVFEFPNGYNFI